MRRWGPESRSASAARTRARCRPRPGGRRRRCSTHALPRRDRAPGASPVPVTGGTAAFGSRPATRRALSAHTCEGPSPISEREPPQRSCGGSLREEVEERRPTRERSERASDASRNLPTSRPVLHSFSTALWRKRFPLWGTVGELLRTRRNPAIGPEFGPGPLVRPARRGVELSPRPSAREGGMTRRRGPPGQELVRQVRPHRPVTGLVGTGVDEGIDRERHRAGHRGGSSAQCLETPHAEGSLQLIPGRALPSCIGSPGGASAP